MNKPTKILISTIIIIMFSTQATSKPINLYKNPTYNSKITSKLTPGSQLIPIYYPTKGDWLKAANPKTGQVGWIKFSDLKGTTPLPGFQQLTFNQRIETRNINNSAPQAYRIIEYNGPKKLNPEEIKEFIRQMQVHQSKINGTMQLMLRGMLEDFNNFARMEPLQYEDDFFTFPKLQPMLVVPTKIQKQETNMHARKNRGTSWWTRVKDKLI